MIITYAYALIFIHRRFGSLFWLLGVLIGSLFHKKNGSLLGPYLKAWGSLLVLETVLNDDLIVEVGVLNYPDGPQDVVGSLGGHGQHGGGDP